MHCLGFRDNLLREGWICPFPALSGADEDDGPTMYVDGADEGPRADSMWPLSNGSGVSWNSGNQTLRLSMMAPWLALIYANSAWMLSRKSCIDNVTVV